MKFLKNSLIYLTVTILALIFVMPLLYALYTSLLPLKYIDRIVTLDKFTLENYIKLFSSFPILRWYFNTAFVTVLTVIGNITLDSMAGYALAKFRFPGRDFIFIMVLVTMMIPFQFVITPLYIMITKVNWQNTFACLLVPFFYQCLFIFMARQFFLSIPGELEEAARIDGLSRAGTFFRIIVPISGTLIAIITIFNFTGTWNSYFVPSVFLTTKEMYVLVLGLNTVKDIHFDRQNLSMAGVVLLSAPVLIMFISLQRFFVQGVATTGIKG